MEVYGTGQITRYIASQGPMQHTTKDLWQVGVAVVVVVVVVGGSLVVITKLIFLEVHTSEFKCSASLGKVSTFLSVS